MTVTWTLEAMPHARGIAGGTFDDPHWFDTRGTARRVRRMAG